MGKTADDMRVDVTIGVPKPEAVDKQAVLETLPHGGGHVNVVQGGLQVLNEKTTMIGSLPMPSSLSTSTTANSASSNHGDLS